MNVQHDLEEFVEAFESAWNRNGQADLASFIPSPDHPRYLEVLRELVRVDLEWCWEHGRPKDLNEYRREFPQLFEDPQAVAEIVFEHDRVRRQAEAKLAAINTTRRVEVHPVGRGGERMENLELNAEGFWAHSAGGAPEQAEAFRDLHRSDPQAACRLAQIMSAMPVIGSTFAGFQLVEELGRGGFGRVFLARQGDLANRCVALKISTDLFGESQTLAQLQHTNIVPIHSLHRVGPLQAVCMPYFGATTLAAVLKEIQASAVIPESGKALVSTVHNCQSQTLAGSRVAAGVVAPQRTKSIQSDSNLDSSVMSLPVALNSRSSPGSQKAKPLTKPVRHLGARPASATKFQGASQSGATPKTLETLGELGYVEAILWLGVRIAEGLVHAHEHGILHRDLKPANILLTDDGQPMLLDFNLSEDTKLRSTPFAARLGGTLPYMAPEHLDAFRGGLRVVDGRSDVYSLGVILFELLTGHQPFPRHNGPADTILPRMLVDRQTPPDLRVFNPKASLAVASIVRHCLEPDPTRRYRSAAELVEDLHRQLTNQPLKFAPERSWRERSRKWVRRHPRLAVVALTGAILLPVIGGPALWSVLNEREKRNEDRAARVAALERLDRFHKDLPGVEPLLDVPSPDRHQLDEGLRRARALLSEYGVLDTPDWRNQTGVRYLAESQQQLLADEVQELLLLNAQGLKRLPLAREPEQRDERLREALHLNDLAGACPASGEPGCAVLKQRADLLEQLGQVDEAIAARNKAGEVKPRTARDYFLLAGELMDEHRYRNALELLQNATTLDPHHAGAWYRAGICQMHLEKYDAALTCYKVCVALAPEMPQYRKNRGLIYHQQKQYDLALADFNEVVRLRQENADGYLDRALTYSAMGKHKDAEDDFAAALACPDSPSRIFSMRVFTRIAAGKQPEAEEDRRRSKRSIPADEVSWIWRGMARLPNDPDGALADFEEALKLRPTSKEALQNKAAVLSDHLGKTREAVQVLNQVVELYPDFTAGRIGRGVLLARLGQRKEALADASVCLKQDGTNPIILYQVANIYALTSRQQGADSIGVYPYLAAALLNGFGTELIGTDKDFDPVKNDPAFRQLLDAVEILRDFNKRRSQPLSD
jgi:serine/threonine protein kinase/Flp pilus assembly protein TadD